MVLYRIKLLKIFLIKIILWNYFLIIKIIGGMLFFKWMVNIECYICCYIEVIVFNELRRMNLFYLVW